MQRGSIRVSQARAVKRLFKNEYPQRALLARRGTSRQDTQREQRKHAEQRIAWQLSESGEAQGMQRAEQR